MQNIQENPFAPRQYGQLVKVTDQVYLFRNIVNSSIIIGDNGVAVVDTQVNQTMGKRLLNAIRTITDKPILYAINTHYHWDHTNGNIIFRQARGDCCRTRNDKRLYGEQGTAAGSVSTFSRFQPW